MSETQVMDHMKHIMSELEKLPKENRKDAAVTKVKEIFGAHLPQSLLELTSGLLLAGDSGVSMDEKPSWLDMEKFRKGQKFCRDNFFAVTYNELLALFVLYTFDIGLNVMIFTGASSTPYESFKRYLSTHFRFDNWYTSDPWTRGTPAYNDIRYTRQIHKMVRRTLSDEPEESYEKKIKVNPAWSLSVEETRQDFMAACSTVNPAQCPYIALGNFSNHTIQHANQAAMSITQFGLCGLIVYKPQLFGIHNATDEDLEAFCHVWRGIGYLLGIDDDYNFCRGTLEDVKTRVKDVLEYWIKPNFHVMSPDCEHVLRCLAEGAKYYYPLSNFECILLHVAEIIEVPMPRLSASLPYHTKLLYCLYRFYIYYGSKIPGVQQLMGYTLNRAMVNANNFDEETHKQLKIKSEKTLNPSSWKLKSTRETGKSNIFRSFATKLTAIMVTIVCVIMLY